MEERVFERADGIFALCLIVCGFLYWNLINLNTLGAGVTIFAMVLCGLCLAYFKVKGIRQNRESAFWLAVLSVIAVTFALYDQEAVKGFGFLFLTAVFLLWVAATCRRGVASSFSAYLLGDAVNQGFVVPFSNFGRCAAAIKNLFSKKQEGKGVLVALLGVLVMLPVLAVVVNLLMQADVAFESFVNRFFTMVMPVQLVEYLMQFLMGIPVAFYLFGSVYGNAAGRNASRISKDSVDRMAFSVRFAPKAAVYAGLAALCGVYVLFFAVQGAYLFSAFGGELPETFTYAEYARRGFFELCTVSTINMAVLAVGTLLARRAAAEEPKPLRTLTALLSLMTMLLIATAFSKMVMYIQVFGLTQLRIYTSWFMLLLFMIFTVVLIRQFTRFQASRVVIAGFVALFLLLSLGNVDGAIAKYNIDRYRAGTLAMMDHETFADLSDADVPHLYAYFQELSGNDPKEAEMKRFLWEEIQLVGTDEYFRKGREIDFRDWNWQQHRADRIREQILEDRVWRTD